MQGRPQGSLVMGYLRDWGGKEVAGAVDTREVTGGCRGEICTPRAPSPPWDQAKHRRAPVGRPYPWPPPTHQKPEPEGQRGFYEQTRFKELSKVSKKRTSRITRVRNRAFLNKSSESRTLRPKSPPYLWEVCPSVLAHSQLFLLFHRPHWFPDLCSSLNLPPCPVFQTPGSPSLSFPWRFSQNRLRCVGESPMARLHQTLCFLRYLTQKRCSR